MLTQIAYSQVTKIHYNEVQSIAIRGSLYQRAIYSLEPRASYIRITSLRMPFIINTKGRRGVPEFYGGNSGAIRAGEGGLYSSSLIIATPFHT